MNFTHCCAYLVLLLRLLLLSVRRFQAKCVFMFIDTLNAFKPIESFPIRSDRYRDREEKKPTHDTYRVHKYNMFSNHHTMNTLIFVHCILGFTKSFPTLYTFYLCAYACCLIGVKFFLCSFLVV